MAAYRFCRTDDIALLVDALNRCWSPYFPDEPPMTPATFKRSIRDLQVWCSSCMVAFAGPDPVGVLIGAKRPGGTLIHKIAVHPDHRRVGHGGHLLSSLSSKLAILGPARIVAEVPESLAPACELFNASGYAREAMLTDYIWEADGAFPSDTSLPPLLDSGFARADGGLVIPVTVDDLAANGLLAGNGSHGEADAKADRQGCWTRSIETLSARKEDIAGMAVASDERIEAYVLYLADGDAAPRRDLRELLAADAEIVALRTFIDDGGARLMQLLSRLRAGGISTLRFPKVHPAEASQSLLEALGFHATGHHLLYAARAR